MILLVYMGILRGFNFVKEFMELTYKIMKNMIWSSEELSYGECGSGEWGNLGVDGIAAPFWYVFHIFINFDVEVISEFFGSFSKSFSSFIPSVELFSGPACSGVITFIVAASVFGTAFFFFISFSITEETCKFFGFGNWGEGES